MTTEGLVPLKEINLLPWREEYKEFQRKQFAFFLICAGVLSLLLIIGLHFLINQKINAQLARNQYLNEAIAKADKEVVEIEALKKERIQLVERMGVIQRLQMNRPNVVKLFDGMAKTVPDGLYFTQVNRVNSKINIQGKAESNIRVAAFMRNIETSKWLKSPELSFIEATEGKEKNKDKSAQDMKLAEEPLQFNLNAQQNFVEQ